MKKSARQIRKETHKRKKLIRTTLFGVIVIGVLGLTGLFLKAAFFKPAPPEMTGNVIDVAADMAGFSMKEMRVKAGQPVTVRLTSLDNSHHTDGGGQHQWAVDELDVNIIAPPEGSSFATFTPENAGSYTFYCDICCGGRANPTMNGTLIVEG